MNRILPVSFWASILALPLRRARTDPIDTPSQVSALSEWDPPRSAAKSCVLTLAPSGVLRYHPAF